MSGFRGSFQLFLAVLLTDLASAQLVGCDNGIMCSGGDECVVGNTTNAILGVTSFDSKISPNSPINWAIGSSADPIESSKLDGLSLRSELLSRHTAYSSAQQRHLLRMRLILRGNIQKSPPQQFHSIQLYHLQRGLTSRLRGRSPLASESTGPEPYQLSVILRSELIPLLSPPSRLANRSSAFLPPSRRRLLGNNHL